MRNIFHSIIAKVISIIAAIAITATLNSASAQSSGATPNTNWIVTQTFIGSGSTDYFSDITYYNGLGLEDMHISGNASGNGLSIVTPVVYDECLRPEAKVMLPFESSSSGLGKVTESSIAARYSALYGASDAAYAYTQNIFDSFSLNRQVASIKPGILGRDRTKALTTTYGVSSSSDKVLNLQYVPTDGSINTSTSSTYISGLSKITTCDEEGRTTITFKDVEGRTVLIRQLVSESTDNGLDTYTVYDLSGRPVWVISPEGSALLGTASTHTANGNIATKWSTLYKYDSYGRMIWRRQPGRSEEIIVYDKGDRPVLYQDGHLRADGNKWIYSIFDSQGREVEKILLEAVSTSLDESLLRTVIGYRNMQYPVNDIGSDYRVPCGMFYFVRNLSSTRYGNQQYRTGISSTATSTFTIPSSLAFAEENGVVSSQDRSSATNHLKVYEKIWILGDSSILESTNDYIERAYHYDALGRIIQIVEISPWGDTQRTSYKFDFNGNILIMKERQNHSYGAPEGSNITKTVTYTYDQRGRVLSETTDVSGSGAGPAPVQATVTFSYDELGRATSATTGDGITRSTSYTTQGWINEISAATSTNSSVFNQSLTYLDNGSITNLESKQGTSATRSFDILYDKVGRMTEWKPAGSNVFAEKGITYDRNGNILSLKRYDASGILCDDYTFTYDGNRLSMVTDDMSEYYYSFDMDGRLTSDSRAGISNIGYNELGQIMTAQDLTGTVKYLYLANGDKYAVIRDGCGRVYMGDMVLNFCNLPLMKSLCFESTDIGAGRIVFNGTNALPNYRINDYLGSARVVTDQTGAVLERNDYYAYGGRIDGGVTGTNRYKFSSKEVQDIGSLDWLDFGARMYDTRLGRWTSQDPLAEKYSSLTPYGYCLGNPVNYVDPNGDTPDTIIDAICLLYDLGAAGLSKINGDDLAAKSHLKDAGTDLLFAVIPGLSVGAIKLAKFADRSINLTRLGKELGTFSHALEFGVDSYKNLHKAVVMKYGKGSGLEVHHLIEQRFAPQLGMSVDDMASVVLTKDEHRIFTKRWRELIGYEKSGAKKTTNSVSREEIFETAKKVYKDYPELLKQIEKMK